LNQNEEYKKNLKCDLTGSPRQGMGFTFLMSITMVFVMRQRTDSPNFLEQYQPRHHCSFCWWDICCFLALLSQWQTFGV